ncbi:DUF3618 domain-containing protein [Arsenicicoccus sp. UBA7492]|uniref:DUF3618 domain-containing protein n=1 Tax=Arsenicicoccus sp. UBA7492 TaxID=1946057 RepID=UPI00257BA283|nr:DUF3618 domain-containing protein [Arsenicicoccus sp. UBA7492]
MTEQPNKSVSDLESDIAKSRERLAATIDELAYRAQPKNIVADQKRQLRETVMAKYHSLMGTSAGATTGPSHYSSAGTTTTSHSDASVADQAKAKAEELKTTATLKAEELKATATAKIDELKSRSESHGQHADPAAQTTFADLRSRAQVKADQARLKVDEATHDADGELRMDRVATGLAAAGAVLISLGVARRNRG